MPIISIRKEFADKVAKGEKRLAIIPRRKKAVKEGDKLYLKCGREYLLNSVGESKSLMTIYEIEVNDKTGQISIPCKEVQDIEIDGYLEFLYDNNYLDYYDCEELAKNIGYDFYLSSETSLLNYIEDKYGLPFVGQLVRW